MHPWQSCWVFGSCWNCRSGGPPNRRFNASDDAAVGALIGAALVISAATVWGAILSPRRRLDPPVGIRLAVELALFAGAAIGLAATGYPTWVLSCSPQNC